MCCSPAGRRIMSQTCCSTRPRTNKPQKFRRCSPSLFTLQGERRSAHAFFLYFSRQHISIASLPLTLLPKNTLSFTFFTRLFGVDLETQMLRKFNWRQTGRGEKECRKRIWGTCCRAVLTLWSYFCGSR